MIPCRKHLTRDPPHSTDAHLASGCNRAFQTQKCNQFDSLVQSMHSFHELVNKLQVDEAEHWGETVGIIDTGMVSQHRQSFSTMTMEYKSFMYDTQTGTPAEEQPHRHRYITS
jgi:hypothetical protein